ncbi:alpha/beta fold hydrolase [Nocardia sp. NPDC059246]|uniref:alpha/beta fold hydrolase n=1 Tax=unclassified Nocardia TaxID=2637762 RepID=UPI0036806A56
MRDATKRSSEAPPSVYRAGSGEPLLLIHGFALNWQAWGSVIDELATEFEVLAPTLPGHWGGPGSQQPCTVAGFADFLEELMDDIGWRDAHLAGNSLGGWLALELAARGRGRSVTAIAPAGLWHPDSRAAALVRRKFLGFSRVAPAARFARHPLVPNVARRALMRPLVDRPDRVSPDLMAAAIEAPSHCGCFDTVANDSESATAAAALQRTRVPAAVLFCERDRVIPPEHYGRHIVRELPAVATKTLPGVGHVPMLEAADLVAGEIRDFIRSTGVAARSA